MTGTAREHQAGSGNERPLIAHVVYRLDVGGLENGVVNLINELPSERFRHCVIALTECTDFRLRIRHPDVACVALNKRPGKDPALMMRLWRAFRAFRPAIVHTRNLATLEAQVPAFLAGVPARIHGEHGWDMDDLQASSRKPRLIRRVVRPFVHEYVALSSHIATYLRDRIGVAEARLHHIYNGVDCQRFRPGRDRELVAQQFGTPSCTVIGTVGRLQAVKDQATLIRAFAHAREHGGASATDLRLAVIGDGPLRGALESLAEELGVGPQVWFGGARNDIPDLLAGLDVFALPSLAEGVSNTVLEAMASGLPVVATNVGGNPELVEDGVTGALVPPGDPAALANVLLGYVAEPEARNRQGRAARKAAEERFSLTTMVDGYCRLYENTIAPRSRHPASDGPARRRATR